MSEIVIIGAGLTGLSAAYHLGEGYVVLEKEERPGGLLRTEERDGFFFNHTGHWLHTRYPHIKELVSKLLRGNCLEIERLSKIYSNKVFTEFPFQANLYGLPRDVQYECLIGAIRAETNRSRNPKPANFLEYVNYYFGEGIARHFIVPYNTKLWGVNPSEITVEWCERFVPKPDIDAIVRGALGPDTEKLGYNVKFIYPARGGIESLARGFAANVRNIVTGTKPDAISTEEKWIEFNGMRQKYSRCVSTIPLPELVDIIVDCPGEVMEARKKLRCSTLKYMNVGLAIESPFNGAHWIYVPEKKYHFYRVGCSSNAVKSLASAGKSALYVEFACDREVSDNEAKEDFRGFLGETGVSRDAILFEDMRRIDYAYVIYDRETPSAREGILSFLKSKGIISTGRYGGWKYSSMEDAVVDGMDAAEEIIKCSKRL